MGTWNMWGIIHSLFVSFISSFAAKWKLDYTALSSFSLLSTWFLFCFTLITRCVRESDVTSFQIDGVEESRLFVRVSCASDRTEHSSFCPSEGGKTHIAQRILLMHKQGEDRAHIFTVFKSTVNEFIQKQSHVNWINGQCVNSTVHVLCVVY